MANKSVKSYTKNEQGISEITVNEVEVVTVDTDNPIAQQLAAAQTGATGAENVTQGVIS